MGMSGIDMAALKAIVPVGEPVAYLAEGGRSGLFLWTAGNFSTQVASDTLEGVYIKADTIAATSGAWVRQFGNAPIDPRWWGAMGDLSADAAPALRAAINFAAGRRVHVPVGQYLINSIIQVTIPPHVTGDGNGAGPGPGAQSNDNCTQFLLNYTNPSLFEVTSVYPPIFRDFQINVHPTYRNPTGGAQIQLIGAGGANMSNARIQNVAFNEGYRGIYMLNASVHLIEGCFFSGWVQDAIYSASTGIETAAGHICHNYFFGEAGTGQAACINIRNGYTMVHDNWIVGGQYGVKIEIANHPAGEITIKNNTIEEQAYNGIYAASVDANPTNGAASMFNFSGNEFSNLYTGSTYIGAIYVVERADGNIWLTDLLVCGNTTRSTSGAGAAHVRISAGQNVTISENVLQELGPGAPYGIVVNGVITNASLGNNIQVLDTTFLGTFTSKFIFKPGVVTWRHQMPLTAAEILAIDAREGSMVYASDGQSDGSTNRLLNGGGVGTMAMRRSGTWCTWI